MEQVSYGPPTCVYGLPYVQSDGPPLPYMEHISYGPPHVHMVPPHVWSDGPPLPYMEHISYGPPHMYDMIFSGLLRKNPLRVLTRQKAFIPESY